VGDNDPEGGVPPENPADAPESKDPKLGGSRDLKKFDGPKGEKAWGNRKPEPADPRAPKQGPAQEISFGPLSALRTASDHAYAFSTKENAQDKTFVEGLKVKTSDIEIGSVNIKLNEGKGKIVGIKGTAEASVVHGEVDLVELVTGWIFGKQNPASPELPENPSVSMAPMAARLGDLTTHGSPLMPGTGSPNVMIGGMPAWRVGLDLSMCPFPGAAPHGTGPTAVGEPTVLINGMPAARMGDYVLEPTGGPNVIVTGCATVMIGKPAAPPPPKPAAAATPQEDPWVVFEAVATGDVVEGSAKGDVSAEWDARKAKGKVEASAGAEVALFKGKLPLGVKVRIPGTSYHLALGVTGEGTALALGAEGGIGGKINGDDGKLFSGTAGAKVSAGLVGLGVKFNVDISK
jgi:uncharacterized Zn-binding protein involved in type VI secretion